MTAGRDTRWWGGLGLGLGLVVGCGAGPERGVAEATPEVPSPSAVPVESAREPEPSPPEGLDLIGQPAPGWGSLDWLGIEPLRLQDLRGRVVLIRFFTDTCPFCRATAPALATLDADYRDRGVTVIGMYHPKPRGKRPTKEQVAEVIRGWGWRFGVGLDLDWAVLDAFWLGQGPRRYTSVSFVLDREGIIRHVHPGPEFHPGGPQDHSRCRRDYEQLRTTLEALLAEPVANRAVEAPESP